MSIIGCAPKTKKEKRKNSNQYLNFIDKKEVWKASRVGLLHEADLGLIPGIAYGFSKE